MSQVGGFSQETVLYAVCECGNSLCFVPIYCLLIFKLLSYLPHLCLSHCLSISDVYMLHWPDSMQPGRSNRELRAESWRALEELIEQRLCRSIGVSNFMIHHLEQLKQDCTVVPHVNQVEYHPYQQPNKLMENRRQQGITFQGYCPLAKGQALSDPTIIQLAQKYGCTPAQICICWSIQVIFMTINGNCIGRQETIKNLHDGRRVSWDPANVE
uniref:Zgc:110366 n=1 Tax=Sander lucioperca TaxID=283035 RepID=A0A8D0ALC4_SANLU